jgi:hypothetical protein
MILMLYNKCVFIDVGFFENVKDGGSIWYQIWVA